MAYKDFEQMDSMAVPHHFDEKLRRQDEKVRKILKDSRASEAYPEPQK